MNKNDQTSSADKKQDNSFLVGIALGSIGGFLLFVGIQSYLSPAREGWIFDYQGLIGGVFTLIAAFIAYIAGMKQFQHHKDAKINEEKSIASLLKEEAYNIELQISLFIEKFENPDSSDVISKYGYILHSEENNLNYNARDLDNLYEDFDFEIPESFFDYSILSKLGDKRARNAINFRHVLQLIKSRYFKPRRNWTPGLYADGVNYYQMLEDYKQAKECFRKAFGVVFRPPTINFVLDDPSLRPLDLPFINHKND